MRAVLLAAGRGMRLRQADAETFPKCLLRFDGETLLARHLRLLAAAGVDEVVVGLGFQPAAVEAELDRLGVRSTVETVLNPRYELGSVLTVHTTAEALTRGGDVLLMDADVLYDDRMLDALVADDHADRLLIDRGFVPGDEPVKVCVRDGRVVEFRKRVTEGLAYDVIGESVGFFRITEHTVRRFVALVAGYVARERADQPHEEAVRDLLLEDPSAFDIADVTGTPWIEIDFPDDIVRATHDILPRLQRRVGALR